MPSLPDVAVTIRRAPGADNLDKDELVNKGVSPMRVLTFEEAFQGLHKSDLHCVSYRLINRDGEFEDDKFPRCNKPVLSKVRSIGGDLVTTFMIFDWDCKDHHTGWTPQEEERAQKELELADELVSQATLLYTTTGGMRLVFALEEPVSVDQAERYHLGMTYKFLDLGMRMDPNCEDWTRLMRLPRVVREEEEKGEDGKAAIRRWRTDKDPYFEEVFNPDNSIRVQDLVSPVSKRDSSYALVQELDLPKPDMPPSLETIFYDMVGMSKTQQEWFRRAKVRLRGRDCADPLFKGKPLAQPGMRDSEIHRLVGEAVNLLHDPEEKLYTIDNVFYLFLDPVRALPKDEKQPNKDWTDVLWRACCRYWALEDAKIDAVKQQEAKQQVEATDQKTELMKGVRSWCNEPIVHEAGAEAWEWVERRLIPMTASGHCYTMMPDGFYSRTAIRLQQLPAQIKMSGMDALMPLKETQIIGNAAIVKDVSSQKLINQYALPIRRVVASAGNMGTILRDTCGFDPVLDLKTYGVRELTPEYNINIDTWLRLLATTKENYQILIEWIALAIAIKMGSICGLSITGPAGIGKKLLVQGLAEVFTNGVYANHKVFGRFNGLLLDTPIININEGMPYRSAIGEIGPSETFRSFIGGDQLLVEEKFQPQIHMQCAPRIIVTTNNLDLVEMLAGGKDLTRNDREAIAIRVLHLELDDGAEKWLRSKGNHSFTAKPGARWIREEAGGDNDYLVAKHFLWIHENCIPSAESLRGRRLLMEGNLDSEFSQLLATRSGTAPYVIQTLIHMLESSVKNDGVVVEDDGTLYVTCYAVTDVAQRSSVFQNVRISSKEVAKVLTAISVDKPIQRQLNNDPKKRRVRWYKVDPQMLLQEAQGLGIQSDRLESIASYGSPTFTPEPKKEKEQSSSIDWKKITNGK